MANIREVKSAFSDFECNDVAVWDSAVALAVQLGLDPTELAEKYELFAMNKKKFQEPITIQLFGTFAEGLKKEKAKENLPGNLGIGKPAPKVTPLVPRVGQRVDTVMDTGPAQMQVDTNTAPIQTSTNTAFNVQPLLNGHLPDVIKGKAKCAHLEGPQLPRAFRTLSDYLPAVATHLERRINAMETLLTDSGREITAVNMGSEADVVVAGRICHNAEATSTSIATLELEGSRGVSSGARTKLDCSLLSSFSFFPGQVVGILGRNPTGSCLTPHKVIDTMPAPVDTPLQEIPAAMHHQCARVVIASGPFVPSGKLEFSGLHAVLSYCKQHPPDALILCGPFIPDTHSELLNLRTSFQDLFAQQVVGPAKELCRTCPGTQVLIQPATSDAQHLPVHPQPAFVGASLAPAESIPAPAHLRCGASLISLTSTGVFADLGSSECGKQELQGDRMARLFKHILQQRLMYPVFPPALGSCVDWHHSKHLDMQRIPNILVLPSPLPPCAKVVEIPATGNATGGSTVCVNTGYACKGSSGMFVELHCPGSTSLEGSHSKTKVCVVKWSQGSKQ